MTRSTRSILLASTALGFLCCAPAQAAEPNTAEALKALQAQVNALQKQITQLQKKAPAEKGVAVKDVAPVESGKKEILPGVSVKFGGWLATEAAWRDNNLSTGLDSALNSIPFENERNAHHDEFRSSIMETRLNVLAEGKPDEDTKVAGFAEIDLSGAATTSNESKTNSYVPRIRHAYATIDRKDLGGSVLVGQAFSLTSAFKKGLAPRQEVGVQTIDKTGPVGFMYTRSPSIRLTKTFADDTMNFALAFEGSEVSTGGTASKITVPAGVTLTNASTSVNTNSVDYAPDVIAKWAYDSPIGHYELYGMGRFFRDVVGTTAFNKNYTMALSGGASAYISLLPKQLELAANIAAGRGIGRYSAASLPDVAFTPSGDIKPLTQMTGLVGLIGHPTSALDVYLYAGAEKVMRQEYENTAFGYGSSLIDNSGCYTGGGTCNAQTETIWQISPGFWAQVYKGDYGWMKVGGQYSFTRRNAFSGLDEQNPHADENIVMISFKYSPF